MTLKLLSLFILATIISGMMAKPSFAGLDAKKEYRSSVDTEFVIYNSEEEEDDDGDEEEGSDQEEEE